MATRKKATKKKAVSKRQFISSKTTAKEQPPIKIVIEVIVRTETTGDKGINKIGTSFVNAIIEAVQPSNFSYSFSRTNCTVLSFLVEFYKTDNPSDSGDFFSPVLDPNDPQQVRVIVLARQDLPAGNGTLALKYNGKDVFTTPETISFSGGIGSINKLVNLPK